MRCQVAGILLRRYLHAVMDRVRNTPSFLYQCAVQRAFRRAMPAQLSSGVKMPAWMMCFTAGLRFIFQDYGWIPVDPSRGDQDWPRDQAAAIGSVSGTLLITTQSGGGSETLGWTYNSNQFWTTEPKTYVNFENFADWEVVP